MNQRLVSMATILVAAGILVPHAAFTATTAGSGHQAPGHSKNDSKSTKWHDDKPYRATIEIVGPGGGGKAVSGVVFEDGNRDGQYNYGDRGIPDVMVSNGKDVVLTDRHGRYQFTESQYRSDMNIFVSKPACYEMPVDKNNVPQFAYTHKEYGSEKQMVFGGLEATGGLPEQINFPLIEGRCHQRFKLAISGDPQPYSNIEVGYVRDTLAKELADRDDLQAVIVEGDVMGDDMGLLPRFINNMSAAKVPQYLVVGNHDLDYDADTDDDSSDTFRRIWGPNYYSFTIGKVHFVVFDNVTYPCTNNTPGTDEVDPENRWEFCNEGKTYNGRISDTQLKWLENDLKYVPQDHLIVLNYHIPTVSFVDQYAYKHSEDNAVRLYNILGYQLNADGTWTQGRPALALSGHTHTNEQFRPGELFEGWTEASHRAPMPFPQIVAGAACGSWWSGDVNDDLIPESYQRLGAPKGYFVLSFKGNQYRDTFKATGKAADKQMSLSFNSPAFRHWYTTLSDWYLDEDPNKSTVPPVNTNNLGDNKMLKPTDLAETNLIINVWNGSRDSQVWVKFDDYDAILAERTQQGDGEGFAEDIMKRLDPYALRRQMNVLRFALKSTEVDENQQWNGDLSDRSDGFEMFNASMLRADSQQPLSAGNWTTQSNHVWAVPVPTDLTDGVHRAHVYTKDVHGQEYEESLLFEVRTPNESTDPIDNDPTDEKYDRQVPSEL